MKQYIFFAVIVFSAVFCCSAKPGYVGSNVPYRSSVYATGYNVPLASASAAAAASSVARSGYVYQVPSYIIDGGSSGYAVYSPSYGGNPYGFY